MDFNNLRAQVTLQLLLLCIATVSCVLLAQGGYTFTLLLLLLAMGYQGYRILRLAEQGNQELSDFLSGIRYDDFSQQFPEKGKDPSLSRLAREFNRVFEQFRQLRAEKEAEARYIKNILQHVGIGIISFGQRGQVQFANSTAKRLLQLPQLQQMAQLQAVYPELYQGMCALRTGGRTLMRLQVGGKEMQFALYAIDLFLKGEVFKLITLQNLSSELEEQEMMAWQNLVRVLTHEIMNSVTPITSLAGSIEVQVQEYLEEGVPMPPEELDDMAMAARTIYRRGNALSQFVQDFRAMTKLPAPQLDTVPVAELFEEVVQLMEPICQQSGVRLLSAQQAPNMLLHIDRGQIAQVLINLVKNALQALQELEDEERPDKVIRLQAGFSEQGRPYIKVTDNGPGIDPDAMERIFLPFYTTKREGSGIGLSLSRQIMRQHKGNLTASSLVDVGSEFILRF